jgi:indolepyruvate ferredoxin oxidoreductase, alpha subunit
MPRRILLGDECVALGAVHAGLSSAYSYPGTPATEILEYLVAYYEKHGRPFATWCANEKTAMEEALGTCFVGRRALVSMKHVGLNVAADPFVNAALVGTHGGLVVAVADDPGMHSSQNEQDSRFYADFARVICLEPANQQEAYDMTVEAFDLSERFGIPVLLRLVTRLAHSRTAIEVTDTPRPENPIRKPPQPASWILLPSHARTQWHALLGRQAEMTAWSEGSRWNRLTLADRSLGVITTGIARNYFEENVGGMAVHPSHLHIGASPIPIGLVRQLAAHVERVLVIEEGYPLVERQLRGLLETPVKGRPGAPSIAGKMTAEVPPEGELTPDNVRPALGLPVRAVPEPAVLPNRPPQLCQGCPHGHMYDSIKKALASTQPSIVTSDIGCYTLGALPPYQAIESCVCMGASVSMAKGAAEAGFHPVVAVIGDSTFLHSGVTPLLDAVNEDANMTLVILDNEAVAMTGGQPTIAPPTRLKEIVLGLGADPAHVHVVDAMPRKVDENAELLRREIEHRGLSVVIAVRECLETARRKRKQKQAAEAKS